jgi:hypothetical protein
VLGFTAGADAAQLLESDISHPIHQSSYLLTLSAARLAAVLASTEERAKAERAVAELTRKVEATCELMLRGGQAIEPWDATERLAEHSTVVCGQVVALWWAADARFIKVVVKRDGDHELAGGAGHQDGSISRDVPPMRGTDYPNFSRVTVVYPDDADKSEEPIDADKLYFTSTRDAADREASFRAGYGLSCDGRKFLAGRLFYLLAVEPGGHGWAQHLREAHEPPPPLHCYWHRDLEVWVSQA